MKKQIKGYIARPSKGGGTFFFTDCGHRMYSVKQETAYHGCLCPACLMNNVYTILYQHGSDQMQAYLQSAGIKEV